MPTIYQIQDQCRKYLRSLVEFGELVCDSFEAEEERTYFCKKCGYTQYVHLCKQIVEAK